MKVFIKTLGCPKNLVDSEVIIGNILSEKDDITDDPEDADVIILNTCAFIGDAIRESEEEILHLSEFRGRFIVTGCLPQRFKDSLKFNLSSSISNKCDFIVGIGRYDFWKGFNLEDLPKTPLLISSNNYILEDKNRVILTPPHYAYLRIAEGCSNRCSYCTIPYIRGPYRSKKIEDILQETEGLQNIGVKELILIAQDITNYGFDLYKKYNISELINRISKIDRIEWIRLLYAHPAHFMDSMADVIGENNKIVKYIDLPIQHISNTILDSMQRKVTKERIKEIIRRLREIPGMHIRSEVMVGYPGEGEKEFAELIDFILSTKFDSLGIFKFSMEEESPIFRIKDSYNIVSQEEIEERYNIIVEIARQLSYEHNLSLVGKTIKIIVDDIGIGRAYWQAPDIDGCVFFDGDADVGEFVDVEITRVDDYDLYGRLQMLGSKLCP